MSKKSVIIIDVLSKKGDSAIFADWSIRGNGEEMEGHRK